MMNNYQNGNGRHTAAVALAETSTQEQEAALVAEVRAIPLHLIDRDPNQPRKRFDPVTLQELADSIAAHGVLQPIEVVAMPNGRYTINHGERRYRASKLAKMETIPAIVAPYRPERERLLRQIVENAAREDLKPCEEGRAYAELAASGMTVTAIARKLGKSTTIIQGRINLLKLEQEIQDLVDEGKISKDGRVTDALLSIPNVGARLQLARKLSGKNTTIKGWMKAAETVRNALVMKKHPVQPRVPGRRGRPPMVWAAIDDQDVPDEAATVNGQALREAARKMCQQCYVRPEGLADIAWQFIQQQAQATCDACEVQNGPALPMVCKNCPGVEMLSRLMAAAKQPAPAG